MTYSRPVPTFTRPPEQPENPVRRYTSLDPVASIIALREAVNRIEERLAALEANVAK
jgi:hypothetical protein